MSDKPNRLDDLLKNIDLIQANMIAAYNHVGLTAQGIDFFCNYARAGIRAEFAPSAMVPPPGTVYLLEGKPHRICGCDRMSNVCQQTRSGTRKLETCGFSQCLIPVNDVLMMGSTDGGSHG